MAVSLSAHPQLNVPGSPHDVMLHTQAVGMKSLQAAVQPADLAPFRFNCWWSTDWSHVICKCYNFLLWSHFLFGNYNSLSDTGHVLVKTIINWLVTCSVTVLQIPDSSCAMFRYYNYLSDRSALKPMVTFYKIYYTFFRISFDINSYTIHITMVMYCTHLRTYMFCYLHWHVGTLIHCTQIPYFSAICTYTTLYASFWFDFRTEY